MLLHSIDKVEQPTAPGRQNVSLTESIPQREPVIETEMVEEVNNEIEKISVEDSEEKARQEKFGLKEKEFKEEQLKEKRVCMKVHFKEKQIMELKMNIEQSQLSLKYFQQKKYLQATDINYQRSLLEEVNTLRNKIGKCNEHIKQLEIKRWDLNTMAENMREAYQQEDSISRCKPQEYTKEQIQSEKKRVEDYKDQIKKTNEEIKKLREKHLQNSDNYSTIRLQLKEQNEKNNQLKQEIEDMNRNR